MRLLTEKVVCFYEKGRLKIWAAPKGVGFHSFWLVLYDTSNLILAVSNRSNFIYPLSPMTVQIQSMYGDLSRIFPTFVYNDNNP